MKIGMHVKNIQNMQSNGGIFKMNSMTTYWIV